MLFLYFRAWVDLISQMQSHICIARPSVAVMANHGLLFLNGSTGSATGNPALPGFICCLHGFLSTTFFEHNHHTRHGGCQFPRCLSGIQLLRDTTQMWPSEEPPGYAALTIQKIFLNPQNSQREALSKVLLMQFVSEEIFFSFIL